MSNSNFNAKTVAFCTSNLTSKLSRDIWTGIQEVSNQLNINSICFAGELLFPKGYNTNQNSANIAYDFIDNRTIDGIILYAGDIGELVSEKRILELCDKFGDIPIVSIARTLPNIPSITINNYAGMFALVDHMLTDHAYRRIAFVKGPEEHPEALERLNAYRDALKKHNVPYDSSIVFPGEFSRSSGHYAVEQLWNGQEVVVDAIVSVDDETAMGVHEALLSHNVQIPDDVAIAGFDNEAMTAVLESPLTTVEQPLFRQGELAVNALINIWNGETSFSHFEIPTELIVRSSCGCQELEYLGVNSPSSFPESTGTEENLQPLRQKMFSILKSIATDQEYSVTDEVLQKLITSLVESHTTGNDRVFSSILWETLSVISARGGFVSPIQQAFSEFHQLCFPILSSKALIRLENMLNRGRIMIGSVAERVNSLQRITAVEKLIDLGDVNYALNALFSRNSAGKLLSNISDSNFDQLGIKSFYLVLYNSSEMPLHESRLLFAWESSVSKEVYEEGITFSTLDLLPEKYRHKLREKHVTLSPLYFNKEQYGYFITETEPWDAMVCDILSWQMSSAFKRVDLIRSEEQRSRELQQSLDELKRTQHRLVEAEKMASLGNLVAGVSHEINTPIGAGITYASYFQEITEQMNKDFSTGKVTKSGFTEFMRKSQEISQGLLINLNRAAELIRSFKEVAVDQTTSERRKFNVKHYIGEILLSLKKLISQNGHTTKLVCSESIEITSYPGHISQVILNLIMNSLSHAFPDGAEGEISLYVSASPDVMTLTYVDNGCGMPPEIKRHIFDPFFTTRRNEGGSGLGMNIVYNLVTQSLGGEITCESEVGDGVIFTITIPTYIE